MQLLLLLVAQVACLVVEVHLGVVDPLLGAAREPDRVPSVPLLLDGVAGVPAGGGRPDRYV